MILDLSLAAFAADVLRTAEPYAIQRRTDRHVSTLNDDRTSDGIPC